MYFEIFINLVWKFSFKWLKGHREEYISLIGCKINPKQKNSTPIKLSEISTMMHEEEEMQNDISNLWDQVQQISPSQRATGNELKGDMDGLKWNVDGLKWDLEGKVSTRKVY